MRAAGLAGVGAADKRRGRPAPAVHDDLVARRFVADAPDRLWCTDITEHPAGDGKVYAAVVARRVLPHCGRLVDRRPHARRTRRRRP
jgi:transposase InsO family protein